MQKLNANDVIEKFGGIRPLATRLGLSASTVQGWKKRGIIPESRIETVLKAAGEDGIALLGDKVTVVSAANDEIEAAKKSEANIKTETAPSKAMVQETTPSETQAPKNVSHVQDIRTEQRVSTVSTVSNVPSDNEENRKASDRRADDRRQFNDENFTDSERRIANRRSGMDRRKIEKLRRKEVLKQKKKFIERSIITTACLFILIVLGGAFIMAPEYIQLKQDAKKVKTLESRMYNIDSRMREMNNRQGSFSGRMSNRINEIEKTTGTVMGRLKAAGDHLGEIDYAGAVQSRLEALEMDFYGMSLKISDVDAVMRNVNGLQQTPGGQKDMIKAMSELQGVVANLKGDVSQLGGAVDNARSENKELALVLKDVSKQDVGAAAMLLALGKFRNTIGRDEEPFAQDVETMRRLVGDDPEMLAALERLAPYAENGILSSDRLSGELKGLAGEIVMAKVTGEELSIQDRALERVNDLVSVRKKGYVEGQETQDVVARAQYLLDRGDVKGAMVELETLEGPAAKAASPWMQKAAGRVIADNTSQNLSDMLLTKLTKGQRGSVSGLDSLLKQGLGGIGGGLGGLGGLGDLGNLGTDFKKIMPGSNRNVLGGSSSGGKSLFGKKTLAFPAQ